MLKINEPKQSKVPLYVFLFYFYGATYVTIEVFFRGRSHWSMFILGAICGILIGQLNEHTPWELGFLWQCFLGMCIVTGFELLWGLILNVWLQLGIWDYSHMWGNVLGQICPLFSLCWFGVSGVAIVLDDYLRYWFFGEEKPRYKLV